MNNFQGIILSVIVIFLLVNPLVFAQEVVPLTEEQAKRIAKDLLLDIPIANSRAIEAAQEEIHTDKQPILLALSIYPQPINSKVNYRLVWNLSFGDPDNKEVLVDAVGGDILSVRSTKHSTLRTKITEFSRNPVYSIGSIIMIMIILIGIFLLKNRRNIPSRPKSLKKQGYKIRKGVMFGFIMIFLALTLGTLIAIHKSLILRHRERLYIETRVNDMTNMYESIIRDVDKALDIITRRAISASVSHVIIEGKGLEQADSRIEELVLNGSFSGTPEALMEDATLPDWIGKMEQVGDLKGYDVSLTFHDFKIKPSDSFNLLIESNIYVNITDQQSVASLRRWVEVKKLVSVEDFEDPVYSLSTLGRTSNMIKKTPYEGNYTQLLVTGNGANDWGYGLSVVIPSLNITDIENVENKAGKILVTDDASSIDVLTLNLFLGVVSEDGINETTMSTYVINAYNAMSLIPDNTKIIIDGDNGKVLYIENLKEHIDNSYYQPSSVGGSFLDRLEGNLTVQERYSNQTNETIGLESFVDKDYLLSLDLPVDLWKTNTDYLYFSQAFIMGDSVKAIDTKFKIDDEVSLNSTHHEIYGVSELLISP